MKIRKGKWKGWKWNSCIVSYRQKGSPSTSHSPPNNFAVYAWEPNLHTRSLSSISCSQASLFQMCLFDQHYLYVDVVISRYTTFQLLRTSNFFSLNLVRESLQDPLLKDMFAQLFASPRRKCLPSTTYYFYRTSFS